MKLKVNQKLQKTKIFTKKDVIAYAELTGDFNPVHFDEKFAKETIFSKPIVHGPLVLTFVTTIFANEFPGPGSVYLSHDIRFCHPVYYNDEITAEMEIIEINSNNHIFIKTTCYNQSKVVVLKGVARLKKY